MRYSVLLLVQFCISVFHFNLMNTCFTVPFTINISQGCFHVFYCFLVLYIIYLSLLHVCSFHCHSYFIVLIFTCIVNVFMLWWKKKNNTFKIITTITFLPNSTEWNIEGRPIQKVQLPEFLSWLYIPSLFQHKKCINTTDWYW